MKNKGIVREIGADFIKIEIFKNTSCAHCTQCNTKSHKVETFFYNKGDLTLNEFVEFEISDKTLLKLSFITYISPIICMFGFYFLASYLRFSESQKIVSCFLGFIFNMFILYFLDKIKGNFFASKITITKEKHS